MGERTLHQKLQNEGEVLRNMKHPTALASVLRFDRILASYNVNPDDRSWPIPTGTHSPSFPRPALQVDLVLASQKPSLVIIIVVLITTSK